MGSIKKCLHIPIVVKTLQVLWILFFARVHAREREREIKFTSFLGPHGSDTIYFKFISNKCNADLNYTCFLVSLTGCCTVATVSITLGNMQYEFWSGGLGVMISFGILCFFYSLGKNAEVGRPHFHPQHYQFTYIYCTLIPTFCIINKCIL
jgi:hypothetical protein